MSLHVHAAGAAFTPDGAVAASAPNAPDGLVTRAADVRYTPDGLVAASAATLPNAASASSTSRFDPAAVRRGEALAAVGDCAGCHTAQGGKAYAGGRALDTPFGTLYGTNITPDPDTGIGRWSESAFARAMRDGVDAEGRYLYPAFPYDHFRHTSDGDIAALYAYLMTREPVVARAPRNALRPPFGARPLVGAWQRLYLDGVAVPQDSSRGDRWNRGAYLVAGLGHCGACHTPRNALGAEDPARTFAGADIEGWHAPGLGRHSPSPVPWDVDAMTAYLRTGIATGHSIAAGPMRGVVRALQEASDDDVRAMAEYVVSLGNGDVQRAQSQPVLEDDSAQGRGARIYATACGTCHDAGRRAWPEGALGPRNWIAATIPSPANLVHIVVEGITPLDGERARWMPAFAGAFTPAQLADLAAYVRARAGQPPWRDVESSVRDVLAAQAASSGTP